MPDAAPPLTPEAIPPKPLVRNRNLVKLGVIAGLALVLLIPLMLLEPVVTDRMVRRDEAVHEIQNSWGASQTIIGPILILPLPQGLIYVLPDDLAVDGDLAPQVRSRGIYDAIVYTTTLRVSGTFRRPSPTELGVPAEQVAWDRAYVALGLSDLRGIGGGVSIHWGAANLPFLPGTELAGLVRTGLHAPVTPPPAGATVPFSVELALHGSDGIRFAPLGVKNEVTLRSPWPHPRFTGMFLPATRDV